MVGCRVALEEGSTTRRATSAGSICRPDVVIADTCPTRTTHNTQIHHSGGVNRRTSSVERRRRICRMMVSQRLLEWKVCGRTRSNREFSDLVRQANATHELPGTKSHPLRGCHHNALSDLWRLAGGALRTRDDCKI